MPDVDPSAAVAVHCGTEGGARQVVSLHAENRMLHEFVTTNRDLIIARTREIVRERSWPSVGIGELEHGVPLFLTQLSETLQRESTSPVSRDEAIGATATRHGGDLLRMGFTVSQVVHDYGDICQAVTLLAIELNAPITVEEFNTLNRCLDTAIAEAVTEHARATAEKRSAEEVERLGHAAHELRDTLNTALLAFHMLKRGAVSINGSTGAILGRSLMTLREVIDSTLAEVRLSAGNQRRTRLSVVSFIDEIGAAGFLHSADRNTLFTVHQVDPTLHIDADPQLLGSAVMNLLHNAFKNTPPGGHIHLRARAENQRLIVEVEDECGGIPTTKGDPFQSFGDRRGLDRSGLGLGLSIARAAVRAHGGEISVRNMPGTGCVFVIDLPLAAEEVAAS
jgi:signal transduction histidine kinase